MIRISIGNRANSKYLSCTADFVLIQSVGTGLMKRKWFERCGNLATVSI